MSAGRSPGGEQSTTRARLAGITLIVASALVGVIAAALVGRPPWGVAAAVVLALATVGVAVGLLLQRRGEAERAQPERGGLGGFSMRHTRRFARIYAAFLVTVSGATALGLLLPGADASGIGPVRAWSVVTIFGVCGLAMLALTSAREPVAVASSARPMAEPTVDSAGWMRLGPPRPALDLRAVTASLFSYQLVQLPLPLVALTPVVLELGPWAVAAVLGACLIGIAALWIVLARRRRPAWISPDGSALRRGRRTLPAREVAQASLTFSPFVPDATARSLTLALGPRRGTHATVPLRRNGRLALSERETAALLRLVGQSSIELPHDEHDPTGRFSKSFHPNHLTKGEALGVVAHPPGDGERLPIGTW